MMITVIWSVSKHSWWWLLQFNPCPSILDDIDWDFINVQAYSMMMGVWSMYKHSCWWSSGFNPCLKTNFFCWVVWIAQSGKALSFRRRGPGFESWGQPYAQCFHPALGMWTLVEGWSIGSEPAIDITHAPAGSDTLRGLVGKSVEWYFPAVGQGWKRGGRLSPGNTKSIWMGVLLVAGSESAYLGESLGFSLMINLLARAKRQPLWGDWHLL